MKDGLVGDGDGSKRVWPDIVSDGEPIDTLPGVARARMEYPRLNREWRTD